ncbi:methylmalonyl-CoA mutase family protein [Caulobacter sp. KR2-114]|uniref:methylmalonyl-CoA mutase family protein n=1 Tax=Caulobacter sp. KR2-114 TaxID=3400912 RepID=UPI003BFF5C04
MDDTVIPLAADFEPARREDWLKLVEKTIKGAPLESLTSRTADGLAVQPLYRAEDAPLAATPRPSGLGWDIRIPVRHPDVAAANAEALEGLANGGASLLLSLDPRGEAGVAVGSEADLARLLDGVMLEVAPVAIDAGFLGGKAADWLGSLAKSAPAAPLQFHLDPLSAFARQGVSPGPIESHLIGAANLAARLATPYPKAGLFLASGIAAHEAGATDAEELAVAVASALAYAKALVRAGMGAPDAFARITLAVAVDHDYFASIAKLRAARKVWAQIAAACGGHCPSRIEARSSGRMLARSDAWTNLIRLTAAGFAAAAGGADAVVLGAFTDALGLPTAFARRQARNTQLILAEEAGLGRVNDPAAGTWYLEALTTDLAAAAWTRFQAIEAAGGIVAALESGLIADQTAAAREALAARIAAGDQKILGVTQFRNPDEAPVEIETVTPSPVPGPDARLPGPDSHCPALSPIRFEDLAA